MPKTGGVVMPRRARVGQVVRKRVDDIFADELLVKITDEIEMSKKEGPKRALMYEARLKMS